MQSICSTGVGDGDIYLSAKQVRERYGGISDMSLWRWLRDGELNFPQPIRINGRRFWRLSALEAFERERATTREIVA